MRSCASEADVSHADGKARFVALARPLLEKIAPGVYRELLLERVAAGHWVSSARLQQWLRQPQGGTSAQSASARALRTASRPCSVPQAGRGSLMTQAITLLLHFPSAATRYSVEQRQALARAGARPGIAVLRELLEELARNRHCSMAQTLERWRERPEYRRLCELAASEPLVPDGAAAGAELTQAVERLLDAQLRGGRLRR